MKTEIYRRITLISQASDIRLAHIFQCSFLGYINACHDLKAITIDEFLRFTDLGIEAFEACEKSMDRAK